MKNFTPISVQFRKHTLLNSATKQYFGGVLFVCLFVSYYQQLKLFPAHENLSGFFYFACYSVAAAFLKPEVF